MCACVRMVCWCGDVAETQQWTQLCELARLMTNGVVYGVNLMGLMCGAAVCWSLQLVCGSDVVMSGRRACVLDL